MQPGQAAAASVCTKGSRHSNLLQARAGSQSGSAYQGTRHSSTALSRLSAFLLASTVRGTPARQGSPHHQGFTRVGRPDLLGSEAQLHLLRPWPQHGSVTDHQRVKQMRPPDPCR